MPEKRYNWILAGLLLASFAIRAFIAAYIELGNDEVYYWTYALYPDWSHFDHPPMVGWFIRIFSFNLLFQEEFFLRLASILAGTLNTYLVYRIGREMFSRRAGLISAFLYTSSLYGFVVAGTFILPDTPQILFWLLALLFFVKAFKFQENRVSAYWMIAAGILTGCALLSKYTSAFLL
ncbi:MAG: glycosyltransferase family 39 protein, partial [Bacteroidetes bacterium]|nr:glycosyltransferase family 39 protein [Bacteroidota bacterium]